MTPVRALLAVFDPAAASSFALDAVELLLTPRPGSVISAVRSTPAGPFVPSEAAIKSLAEGEKPERVGGQCYLTIRRGGVVYRQSLGAYRGGDGRLIPSFANVNILRRVRDRLAGEGRYTARLPKRDDERSNFIDAAHLAADVDLHAEALADLWEAITEAKATYAANVAELFGLGLTPADVHATLHQFELTWDAPCRVARAAPTIYWPAWRSAFRGGGRVAGFSGDVLTVAERGATESREPKAPAGTTVLRADAAKGGGCKLYVKTARTLRFEAELTGERAGALLGRVVKLDSPATLRADLEALAVKPYSALLAAQEALASPDVLDIAEVIGAFLEAGSKRKVMPIVRAFAVGAHFLNERRAHEKELTRLGKAGWVKHLGRGEWAPTPTLAATFALLGSRSRLAEDTPPEPAGARRSTRPARADRRAK